MVYLVLDVENAGWKLKRDGGGAAFVADATDVLGLWGKLSLRTPVERSYSLANSDFTKIICFTFWSFW